MGKKFVCKKEAVGGQRGDQRGDTGGEEKAVAFLAIHPPPTLQDREHAMDKPFFRDEKQTQKKPGPIERGVRKI